MSEVVLSVYSKGKIGYGLVSFLWDNDSFSGYEEMLIRLIVGLMKFTINFKLYSAGF